jgi:hypothetical protein
MFDCDAAFEIVDIFDKQVEYGELLLERGRAGEPVDPTDVEDTITYLSQYVRCKALVADLRSLL